MSIFKNCIPQLLESDITFETRENLIIASSIAGMVISQSGTSIPHGMGYPLTYYHNVPHGKANGILLKEYLSVYSKNNSNKVNRILALLDFATINEFGGFINELLGDKINLSLEDLENYSTYMSSNEAKLKNHPYKLTYEDILYIYKNSIK